MSAPTLARSGSAARGRLGVRAAALAAAAAALVAIGSLLHGGARRHALPLSDAAVIREQAAAKHLDPALIAAVIYAESKFEPRTSPAGALGLMQLLPATAYYIARLSGGASFTSADLATPRINVAYGSYYLRYLLDHYSGQETPALAAYNGGIANADRWLASARAAGEPLTLQRIPFPETREYVRRVLAAQRAYRTTYPSELGPT
jgi:soluble lytic murein transglycosylase